MCRISLITFSVLCATPTNVSLHQVFVVISAQSLPERRLGFPLGAFNSVKGFSDAHLALTLLKALAITSGTRTETGF